MRLLVLCCQRDQRMHESISPDDEAILRIGEVVEVSGRKIFVAVDKEKNVSDLIFNGDILKNISVNSYVEIRKGFLSLIGKVDGEKVIDDSQAASWSGYENRDKNKRVLTISLSGYISKSNKFIGGLKEMPLIGSEAYLLTSAKLHTVHNLVSDKSLSINIAKTDADDYDIGFPIDGLFNSHIAIFGNTGSGKSNTLAYLYQELVSALKLRNQEAFEENSRFLLFDFNGEYIGHECITADKKVYNLSTRVVGGDRIPISEDSLMDLEVLSILADATDKTQKPFIRRALRFYKDVTGSADPLNYFQNTLKSKIKQTLQMSDKVRAYLLVDYFKQLLPETDAAGHIVEIDDDLDWHNVSSEFMRQPGPHFLSSTPAEIENTFMYQRVDQYELQNDLLSMFIHFLYIQLIFDVISNRAQNEHIAPAINKLRSKKSDIDKVFDTTGAESIWESNFVVVNLNDVNLEMKKTIPLLLSKRLYIDHKSEGNEKSLNFIIDEAHNILSRDSFREAESWKDYRLETFEEIIKEGRKFGVFVTISSQRPSDISPTLTSQAHNYFIHRLINQKDLAMISSVVSYIDRVTEESIPVLPTGACIFSGVASPMPLKLNVKELDLHLQPNSTTLAYKDIVPEVAI